MLLLKIFMIPITVVTARDCLLGPTFSVRESVDGWSEGLANLLDCLIGLPSMETRNLELRLHEERAKYLVCELTCPLEGSVRDIVTYVRRQMERNWTEKGGGGVALLLRDGLTYRERSDLGTFTEGCLSRSLWR